MTVYKAPGREQDCRNFNSSGRLCETLMPSRQCPTFIYSMCLPFIKFTLRFPTMEGGCMARGHIEVIRRNKVFDSSSRLHSRGMFKKDYLLRQCLSCIIPDLLK